MKVNLFDMTKKVLFEEIDKPTKEEEEKWRTENKEGKLYYVIRGEDNNIIKYIDTSLVEEYNTEVGKKYPPKKVAEYLFERIGYEQDKNENEINEKEKTESSGNEEIQSENEIQEQGDAKTPDNEK